MVSFGPLHGQFGLRGSDLGLRQVFALNGSGVSVIGELLAGVLLGPSLLGRIEVTEVIRLLAEIGIILLLFDVGLDTDIRRLTRSGGQSVTAALGGFIAPFAFGYLICRLVFGQEVLLSLFVGGALMGRNVPLRVWGPSGAVPELGTRYALERMQEMLTWDLAGRVGATATPGPMRIVLVRSATRASMA